MSDPLPLFPVPQRKPLAEKLRPQSFDAVIGMKKDHRLFLQRAKEGSGIPPSVLLWGPPGCGKTTLARIYLNSFPLFKSVELSAVSSGVKEVRELCESGKRTPVMLFVDEIHRFSKSQQDVFLPYLERGDVVLIGATTENPSFYLTSALLSRMRVLDFGAHDDASLLMMLINAEKHQGFSIEDSGRALLVAFAQGDARKLLNAAEAVLSSPLVAGKLIISEADVATQLKDSSTVLYDRSGDEHYQTVSAFIKSLRGSDPDAALFWGFKMIEAGEDPRFVLRRMMIFASEDIGNADPRALTLAVTTAEAFDRIGLPEGKIPIAQCITYLAMAPKSNRSYQAMKNVCQALKEHPRTVVPLHLRNAPTDLMKNLHYGEGYENPHFSGVKQEYLPSEIAGGFFHPSDEGYEGKVAEMWRQRNRINEKIDVAHQRIPVLVKKT